MTPYDARSRSCLRTRERLWWSIDNDAFARSAVDSGIVFVAVLRDGGLDFLLWASDARWRLGATEKWTDEQVKEGKK